MKKRQRMIVCFFAVLTVMTLFATSASALNWNGTAVSGVGASNAQNTGGYTIRLIGSDGCFGYRFSVVNSAGSTVKKSGYPSSVDVFRNLTLDGVSNKVYNSYNSASVKYNKKELITNRQTVSLSMTAIKNQSNSYLMSAMGFASALPAPSGMETWQANNANLNKVLAKLGINGVSNFVYGDRLLVEPLFVMEIAGSQYNAMTATEIALYGAAFYGDSSSTGGSSSNAGTWGYAANYTNMYFPRTLYTGISSMLSNLWSVGSNLTSKTSFENIITKGYGVGIAYSNYTSVTVTLNKGKGIASVSGAGTYGVGSSVTINATMSTGYQWSKWTGTKASSTKNYTFTMPSSNVTNTANATPITYTITHDPNGGGWGSDTEKDVREYTIEDEVNILVPPTREGYAFSGWKVTSEGGCWRLNSLYWVDDTALSYRNMYGNVTLTAQWTPFTLTVMYDCYGSNVTIDTSKGYSLGSYNRLCTTTYTHKDMWGTSNVYYKTYTYNSAIGTDGLHDFSTFGLSAPTGYRFAGWYCNGRTFDESTTTYKPTDFTDDIKTGSAEVWLSARFTPVTYSVKFNGNGSTSGSMSNQSHTYDTSKALTANAFKREFTVTYNYNGNGSANTTAKATATFGDWATSASGSRVYSKQQSFKNLSSTQGATVNLYAKWTDGSVTLPSPTRTGYTLSGWYTAASGGTKIGNGGASYTPSANITLYAQWTPITYTVTYDKNTTATVSNMPANGTKTYGVNYYIPNTTPTRTGYVFDHWEATATSNTSNWWFKYGYSYNASSTPKTSPYRDVNQSFTLYAQWTPITYSVKFNGNGATSGSMSNQSHTYDSSKALTQNAFKREFTVTYNYNGNGQSNTSAKASAAFGGWATSAAGSKAYDDKQSVKNLTSTSGATVNLYAKWTDGSVTLPSPTRSGYSFDGWYTAASGGTKAGDGGASYRPSANITLYAHWTPGTYTVTYNKNTTDTVSNMPANATKTHGVNYYIPNTGKLPRQAARRTGGSNTAIRTTRRQRRKPRRIVTSIRASLFTLSGRRLRIPLNSTETGIRRAA